MKVTFLGTGTSQGVPVIGCDCNVCKSADVRDVRLRTSALLQSDRGNTILIDIGPDFRQQMLRHKVTHLDAILITHAHRDHVAGLDDIRAYNYLQHGALPLYANRMAMVSLRRDYHYIFEPHEFPGLPEVEPFEVDGGGVIEIGGEEVMPIAAMHKDLPILGYRIGGFAYLTDVSRIEEGEKEKLRGVDVLVVNALRQTPHWSHFSLPQALELIGEMRPREAYITHISHEMGRHAEVEKGLPTNVRLAYDGLVVSI